MHCQASDLPNSERERGLAVFNLMDVDGGGSVSIDEICIVHDSDKDSMIQILDADESGEVTNMNASMYSSLVVVLYDAQKTQLL